MPLARRAKPSSIPSPPTERNCRKKVFQADLKPPKRLFEKEFRKLRGRRQAPPPRDHRPGPKKRRKSGNASRNWMFSRPGKTAEEFRRLKKFFKIKSAGDPMVGTANFKVSSRRNLFRRPAPGFAAATKDYWIDAPRRRRSRAPRLDPLFFRFLPSIISNRSSEANPFQTGLNAENRPTEFGGNVT